MAKRMINSEIIESESFNMMSIKARYLYIVLNLNADSYGIINSVKPLLSKCNMRIPTFNELVSNGFILYFEEEKIAVITHWRIHNKLKYVSVSTSSYLEMFKRIYLRGDELYSLSYDDSVTSLFAYRQAIKNLGAAETSKRFKKACDKGAFISDLCHFNLINESQNPCVNGKSEKKLEKIFHEEKRSEEKRSEENRIEFEAAVAARENVTAGRGPLLENSSGGTTGGTTGGEQFESLDFGTSFETGRGELYGEAFGRGDEGGDLDAYGHGDVDAYGHGDVDAYGCGDEGGDDCGEGVLPADYDVLKRLSGIGRGVVMLSDRQTDALLDSLSLDEFDNYIGRLADFIVKRDAHIKSHYATILKWVREDRQS